MIELAPPDGRDGVVEVRHLTKRFGSVLAVDDLSFQVMPGRVTGFLGPNGAGKTTTLRMLLGLVQPTSGNATVGGVTYDRLTHPLQRVGAALEATGFHSGRTARDHLRVMATAASVPTSRADQLLGELGLADALGMRQRLALAAAMLGDPPVLLLDEPANGLDPEGIAWLRGFLRHLAGQGRTILVSSHLLSEVQQSVDDVLIIARGKLIRQASLAELEGGAAVVVRSPTADQLAAALTREGFTVNPQGDGVLRVAAAESGVVGAVAFRSGIEVHELRRDENDLEAIFLSLTGDAASAPATGAAAPVSEVTR